MPLLSIIVPTYNCENCISACVESIISQKFSDYEIVIQDGRSSDTTLELLEKIRALNPLVSIHIESGKDDGIYDAMNKAIEKAKGEWLYFIGSDDKLYNNEVLSTVFNGKRVEEYDVLYGNVNSVRFDGVYDGEFTREKLLEQNICHQAIFFRRSVFKEVGLYDLNFKAHADWDHNIRWFLSNTLSKKYIDVIVAEYADGGFSSLSSDVEFLKVKNLKYLRYGRNVLKTKTKIKMLTVELIAALRSKDRKMVWNIISTTPSMLL